MEFYANFVSTSVAGDYYQVSFEENDERTEFDGAYLLIQRQFDEPEDNYVYIETHDDELIGHCSIRRIEFSPTTIFVEIDRFKNNCIKVVFDLTSEEFDNVLPVLKIISGEEKFFLMNDFS